MLTGGVRKRCRKGLFGIEHFLGISRNLNSILCSDFSSRNQSFIYFEFGIDNAASQSRSIFLVTFHSLFLPCQNILIFREKSKFLESRVILGIEICFAFEFFNHDKTSIKFSRGTNLDTRNGNRAIS